MTSLHNDPNILNYIHHHDVAPLRCVKDRPSEDPNTIIGMLARDTKFKIFTEMIYRSGFDNKLRDVNSKFTVFAPSDKAFRNMPEHLLRELEYYQVSHIVAKHILDYPVSLRGMKYQRQYVKTLHPHENLLIDGRGLGFPRLGLRHQSSSVSPTVNYTPEIVSGDFIALNGIIHILDNSPIIPHSH